MMKPIKGEEWIEEMREREFWIGEKHSYPEPFYARLAQSYLGWWCYFRLHRLWPRLALLIDPLNCGGLWSHVQGFLFNAIVVDIWWRLKHRVWRLFHRREWEAQCRLMELVAEASRKEGFWLDSVKYVNPQREDPNVGK